MVIDGNFTVCIHLTDIKRIQMAITHLNLFSKSITVSTFFTLFNLNGISVGTVQEIFYGRYERYQANLAV
jgi:hypothetical protein